MTEVQSKGLEAAEAVAAEGAVAPRVSLESMKAAMEQVSFFNLGDAMDAVASGGATLGAELMTICVITMKNGFIVLGKSAPASPENFDQSKGEQFAYEDAVRQLWPLMGFALKESLQRNPPS